MGFFKTLFGGKPETEEQQKKNDEGRQFDVLKYDGVKAMRLHITDHATRCFQAALKIHDDLEIHDYLSQVFMMANQMPEALGEIEILKRAEPENTGIIMRSVQVRYMMEDYEGMAGECKAILQLKEDEALASLMLARAQLGLNNTGEALQTLTDVIQREPDFADARLLKAGTLIKEHRPEEAEEDTAWLMEAAPDNEDVLLLKVRLEHEKGNLEQALEYCNKVIDVNPFSADAFNERAELRKSMGDEEGARQDLEYVKTLTPENDNQDIARKMQEESSLNPLM